MIKIFLLTITEYWKKQLASTSTTHAQPFHFRFQVRSKALVIWGGTIYWKTNILVISILILKSAISKYWYQYWYWNLPLIYIATNIDIEKNMNIDIGIYIDIEEIKSIFVDFTASLKQILFHCLYDFAKNLSIYVKFFQFPLFRWNIMKN